MDRGNPFYRQAALVVRALPHVARREEFALKGGTAINLFLRDLPRLSIDIDLAYLPRMPREEALAAIRRGLDAVAADLKSAIPGIGVQATDPSATDALRLTLALNGCRIKIEVSPVARGAVWPNETREVVAAVEESLGYSENRLLSFNDLYAGKMCAALDRQHPRDLFDIALLLENEGIGRDLLKTFLVYLIGHNRPMAELLAPRRRDIAVLYEGEFSEMTREPVPLRTLLDARERLVAVIRTGLTEEDRSFLLSVKSRSPDWSLIDLPAVAELPAVRWKLINLDRMSEAKHTAALDRLKRVLAE
ncbi:MAG: nucleotidyl transferase AbiEii/AbiGii toxin family protein [Rhodospirillaceae bacterium]|nr:nucleotidyl transferase AbiEii/AbiGii toxin family protein [Rhodospirillaceae bacterium]